MNSMHITNKMLHEPANLIEFPIEQLSVLLRQMSMLSVTISLKWGVSTSPIKLKGRIMEVAQKANWLKLYQSSQQQVHIAISHIAEIFVSPSVKNGALTLVGQDHQGKLCLSLRCDGHSSFDRICWQKAIQAGCHSESCNYAC